LPRASDAAAAPPGAWRHRAATEFRSFLFFGFENRTHAGTRRRGRCCWFGCSGSRGRLGFAKAFLGDLVSFFLGDLVVLAALVLFALAASAASRSAFSAASRWARILASPRRSCALQPRATAHHRARAPGVRALRQSTCAAQTPEDLGGGAGGVRRGSGWRGSPGGRGWTLGGRRRRCSGHRSGGRLGLAVWAADAALLDLDDHLLARPWLKLWRTTPVSVRGLSDSVDFPPTLSVYRQGSWCQPSVAILSIPYAVTALSPAHRSESLQGAQNAPETYHSQARQAGCMYHILTGPVPNPMGQLRMF